MAHCRSPSQETLASCCRFCSPVTQILVCAGLLQLIITANAGQSRCTTGSFHCCAFEQRAHHVSTSGFECEPCQALYLLVATLSSLRALKHGLKTRSQSKQTVTSIMNPEPQGQTPMKTFGRPNKQLATSAWASVDLRQFLNQRRQQLRLSGIELHGQGSGALSCVFLFQVLASAVHLESVHCTRGSEGVSKLQIVSRVVTSRQ